MIKASWIRRKTISAWQHFFVNAPIRNPVKCFPLLMLFFPLTRLQAQQTPPFSKTINITLSNRKQHCVPCTILTETQKGDHIVKGRVMDNLKKHVSGAYVVVVELNKFTTSDSLGYFCFRSDIPTDTLHVTAHLTGYLGHEKKILPGTDEIIVPLQREPGNSLPGVMVISCSFGHPGCRILSPSIVSLAERSGLAGPLTGKLPGINFTPIIPVYWENISSLLEL